MQDQSSSVMRGIYIWFLRILATFSLIAGLTYWAQLVGMTGEGTMRFDLIEPHWRVLSTVLAVVLPAAALGLWLGQAWGVVLWIIAIAIETAAFGVWIDLYSAKPLLVIGHGVSFTFLCVLVIALFMQRRRGRTL